MRRITSRCQKAGATTGLERDSDATITSDSPPSQRKAHQPIPLKPDVSTQNNPNAKVLNQRQFEIITHREIERTRNQGPPLSLLSIRIDRSDSVTDDGSSSSQSALSEVADTCAKLLRTTDIVARVDDTALVALLPGALSTAAQRAAERLRTAIAAMEMPVLRRRFQHVTVSIGVVTTRTGRTSYRALRSRADAKRDDAKSSGGNRVNA